MYRYWGGAGGRGAPLSPTTHIAHLTLHVHGGLFCAQAQAQQTEQRIQTERAWKRTWKKDERQGINGLSHLVHPSGGFCPRFRPCHTW